MKAIVHDTYGSPDVLKLRDVEKPAVGADTVLVRVHAAAVNPADWHFTTGLPYLIRTASGLGKPKIAIRGRDVAGTVEAVGENVKQLRPGDEVYGEVDGGSFAEYVCVSEDMLDPKPDNLTFEQAATVPLAANTALQGLRDTGKVQAGQKVLINGASGGVGTFAVQIAASMGAEVTGVCSTRNVDMVRSIGADHVIDYTGQDFTRSGDHYDLIFDLVGNLPLPDCRRALTPDGMLILSAGQGGRWFGPVGRIVKALALSAFVGQKLVPLAAKRSKERLAALTDLIEAGKVTPIIDRTYPLSEVPEAIRYVGEGHAQGKIVITV